MHLGQEEPVPDNERAGWAKGFLTSLTKWNESYISHLELDRRIKIAVLDTGFDTEDAALRTAIPEEHRHTRTKSFVEGENVHDKRGHGTHVAKLVSTIAPEATLYAAKISEGDEFDPKRIVDAINWAITKRVDIVTMSWGLRSFDHDIDHAIRQATSRGVIFFASASNSGANAPRSFPSFTPNVIAIHATDGMGNRWGGNPTQQPHGPNFSTLGTMIQSIWKSKKIYLSGTSFATPIAAGLAANLLAAIISLGMKPGLEDCLDHRVVDKAFSTSGMISIFRSMSEVRDGYDYVHPEVKWWKGHFKSQDAIDRHICKMVSDAILEPTSI
ncbi:pfs domain-containing protein [Colletotrichum gloeosporioides Cg-14]|uniref:Pfs domain-containing protein n=1 Tax=Colletotrichum gloeosporioides (strain Cg-14) TaxID=1237896 RepID=T0K073_COLGC|nr:pfs domain-containing protein [Colletotrichum gloeosporioides Cg-14]